MDGTDSRLYDYLDLEAYDVVPGPQYRKLRDAAEYVIDGYDIQHADDAHFENAITKLRAVLDTASGEAGLAGPSDLSRASVAGVSSSVSSPAKDSDA